MPKELTAKYGFANAAGPVNWRPGASIDRFVRMPATERLQQVSAWDSIYIIDAIDPLIQTESKLMSHFIQDFKAFALKGNVIDLAVGVIIGASFGKIVTSLVDDIIMPPLGLIIGKVDFSELFWVLHTVADKPGPFNTIAQAKEAGAVTWNYGLFLNTLFQFLIVALAIFVVVKQIRRLQNHADAQTAAAAAAAPPPPPSTQELLLTDIRDLLKNQQK